MRLAILITAVVMLAAPASATSVVALKLDEIARHADGAVGGTVRNTVARKAPDGSIYTFVTLEELDVVLGRYAERTLTIRLKGGTVGDETLLIEGAPRFREGERVVVFLAGNGQAMMPIVGWEQGLFRVVRDPWSGREVVSDAVGNRIFGIRNGQVLKEDRNASNIELFTPEGRTHRQSGGPSVSFGHSERGEEARPDSSDRSAIPFEAMAGRPLDYARFRQQLREALATVAAPDQGRTITTADSAQLPSTEPVDGRPNPTSAEGAAPVQVPGDRGQVPRRIDRPGDFNPDLPQ